MGTAFKTAFITHSECDLHEMGSGHPECPERLQAIGDQLIASGVLPYMTEYEAPVASNEAIRRVHDERYLRTLEQSVPQNGHVHLDPDTAMNRHSLRAAQRAAGAVEMATDLVLSAQVERAFCAVRPPGHHAERSRAMGFCFLNNVAVGAAHALDHHGLARVAVVDFDVHHGNGTEKIFENDPRVLMVSTFQHPFYPYSGIDGRSPRMVNIPLPARSDGRQFRAAVEIHWLPALESFAPECLFVSAGFDAHAEDDMASLGLVEADYAWVTDRLVEVAKRHCKGRIVSVLEGGYALSALGRSAVAHIKALAEI